MATQTDPAEVKKDFEEFNRLFEQFKEVNDKRGEELKTLNTALSDTLEKQTKLQTRLDELDAKYQRLHTPDADDDSADDAESPNLKKAFFDHFCRWGRMTNAEWKAFGDLPNAFLPNDISKLPEELRSKTLTFADATTGGYIATPPDVDVSILKTVTEYSPIRDYARVRSISGPSFQQRKRTGSIAAVWVSEIGTRSETTGMAWGREDIPCHEMYTWVNISRQNLEDSALDLEAEVSAESGEAFGLAEGTAFISGNAVTRPEGILTNSDVSYTNTGHATVLQADSLAAIMFALKEPYIANSRWYMNRLSMGGIHILKDGNGQYLLKPGLEGKPGWTLHGHPVVACTDLASPSSGVTFSANAFPILFGDMKKAYTIVDRIGITTLRDPYSSAATATITFHLWKRTGGQIVMPEAVRKLKIATS